MGKVVVVVKDYIFLADVSSSLHIRKKRVIDKTANGGLPVHLSMARYIVNIQKDGVPHCVGTILDADIIISTPYCIDERPGAMFTILSNSRLNNNGTPHHITRRSSAPGFGIGDYLKDFSLFIKFYLRINNQASDYNCSSIELTISYSVVQNYSTY